MSKCMGVPDMGVLAVVVLDSDDAGWTERVYGVAARRDPEAEG